MKSFIMLLMPLILIFSSGCERGRKGPLSSPSAGVSSISGSILMVDKGSFPDSYIFMEIVDQSGDPVTKFKLGNVNITENGKPVVVNDLQVGKVGIAVVLVLDRSGSMGGTPTNDLNDAASIFIDKLPVDAIVEIIDFGSEVKVSQVFTTDKTQLKSIINSGTADMGATAFYDAVGQAISDIKDIKDRYKMIIAMTDGMDNSSKEYDIKSLIDEANKSWQPIQVIGYGVDEASLKDLASRTNGNYDYASTGTKLNTIYTELVPSDEIIKVHYRSLSDKAKKVTVHIIYGSLTTGFSIQRN